MLFMLLAIVDCRVLFGNITDGRELFYLKWCNKYGYPKFPTTYYWEGRMCRLERNCLRKTICCRKLDSVQMTLCS